MDRTEVYLSIFEAPVRLKFFSLRVSYGTRVIVDTKGIN